MLGSHFVGVGLLSTGVLSLGLFILHGPRCLFDRAMHLTEQGDWCAAVWLFGQVIAWSGGSLRRDALWNRGCVHLRLADLEAARGDFERLVVVAPGFVSGWENLSNLQHHMGLHAEAWQSAARVWALEPNNPCARRYTDALRTPHRRPMLPVG